MCASVCMFAVSHGGACVGLGMRVRVHRRTKHLSPPVRTRCLFHLLLGPHLLELATDLWVREDGHRPHADIGLIVGRLQSEPLISSP